MHEKVKNYKINDLASLSFRPIYNSKVKSWHEHKPFACDVLNLIKPKIFVELGTHYGDSYFSFCQTNRELELGVKCYAIDNWKGDSQSGLYDEEIYQKVSTYNRENYRNFSELIRSDFDDAIDCFENSSVDLIHIDGHHTYQSIENDFNNWLPKVSEDGVILLHDIMVRSNDFGVWKFWEIIKKNYLTCSFVHGHGLGVIFKSNKKQNIELSAFIESLIKCKYYECLGEKVYLETKNDILKEEVTSLVSSIQKQSKETEKIKFEYKELKKTKENNEEEMLLLKKELDKYKKNKILKLFFLK